MDAQIELLDSALAKLEETKVDGDLILEQLRPSDDLGERLRKY